MLVWVLVVTALLVSDVAGTHNSLELERTQQHREKRELSRGPCDEKWFYFPPLNSCYRFFSDKKTWEEAEDFCNRDERCGQLASVNSEEHNTFISNVVFIVNQKKPTAWIGLNDICKEGNFTWVDGSLYCYSKWAKNQPDDFKRKEDCVNIHRFNDMAWNDAPCDKKNGFVCSYKLC
ncbi:C-type lectin BpLec-like isoform X3 [Hemitrygon akajei]|uniref:C-type lectin BpLec-like isoform X3 n=1 Tax=Hemitrygon akajei TaxID=2704970 RepID=UPI003BF9C829